MNDYLDKALITLSYDDGLLNNYTVALPLHEQFSIPACFAIIAERASNSKHWQRHMNPQQILDASQRGVEINSHGVMHKKKFTDLKHRELTFELRESQRMLRELLSTNSGVDTLCIPFSASNKEIRLEALKYYSIVRGHGGRLNDPTSSNPYILSYGLRNTSTFEEIREKIDFAVQEKKWIVLMLHGVIKGDTADRKYDIPEDLLRRILEYISELGPSRIKPVTFGEVITLRKTQHGDPRAQILLDHGIQREGSHTLAEAPGYLITYHKSQKDSDILVITFGGLPSKKTATGFGSKFLMRRGYDHIFVAQEAGSQYQKLSLEEFAEIIKPHTSGKRVFTYGSSLGAYAALYYGGIIDAKIIASAPKNSAHRFMLKKKYSHIAFRHKDLVDVPRSVHEPLILFDPFREEETQFIDKWVMPAYPQAYVLREPFAGHTVLNTMQESGVLKEFITTYIHSGEILPFTLEQGDSYIWHAEKGRRYLKNGMYDLAKHHFEKSLALRQNGEAAGGLARILLRENKPELAREVVELNYEVNKNHKGVSQSLRTQIEKRVGLAV